MDEYEVKYLQIGGEHIDRIRGDGIALTPHGMAIVDRDDRIIAAYPNYLSAKRVLNIVS